MSRTNALRALYNLCAFIGAIVLFSYFYNWAVDLRHWYVTLASAFVCVILWLGFYVIEARGGVTHILSQIALALSRLRKSAEPLSPSAELPADPPTSCSAVEPRDLEPEVIAPRSATLPWLRPHS